MLPSRIERATGVSGALATSVLLAVALVVTTISAVPAGADPVAWEERAVIWDSHGVPTDLGTLGFSSWGHEINDRNQVIGYFAAEDPGPFSDPVNRTFFWDKGVMVELGPLPGGYWAQPGALNSRGQVAGFSASNEYGDTHAFLWEAGQMIDLGTGDSTRSMGSDINNRGQVVGGLGWWELPGRAFLWEKGTLIDLGTLGGLNSWANSINERGQVVGKAETSDGETHAFLWDKGVMTDLGTLGGTHAEAYKINERGLVIGQSETSTGATHGFLWYRGVMTDLGTLGGDFSSPSDVNSRGQVVGRSLTADDALHAFVWEGGVMTDLGTLGGDQSRARAINNSGLIVGDSIDEEDVQRAVKWDDGALIELVGMDPALGSSAIDVNSRGTAVGRSWIPEPDGG